MPSRKESPSREEIRQETQLVIQSRDQNVCAKTAVSLLSLERIQAGCLEEAAFEMGLQGWVEFKHTERERMTCQARGTP